MYHEAREQTKIDYRLVVVNFASIQSVGCCMYSEA